MLENGHDDVDAGAYVLSGTTASDVRLPARAPDPTVTTVERASTCPPTNSSVSAPTSISVIPVSSSTPAGRRRALTAADAPWNRVTATRAAVDPVTAGSTAVSMTHVPALLAFTVAAVPLFQTPPSGQSAKDSY